MKKNYFIFVFALCSGFISLAQPTLTSTNFTDYFAVSYNVPNLEGVTLGAPGNQDWNYSFLIPDTTFGIYQTTVPLPPSAPAPPGFEEFSSANYCVKYFYTSMGTLYEIYIYVDINSNGTESLGSFSTYSNNSSGFIDTPTSQLPLNYQDTYVSTEQETSTSDLITTTTTYDAYGSLQTTYGSFDVIRLKSLRSDSTSTRYFYFQISPTYLPVMSMTVDNLNVVTDVSLYADAGLGVMQNSTEKKLMVHPNPASNFLNLQLPNNTTIDKITITDLAGKIVKDQTQNTKVVNVEGLANGIYILQGFSGDDKFETKFVKQ